MMLLPRVDTAQTNIRNHALSILRSGQVLNRDVMFLILRLESVNGRRSDANFTNYANKPGIIRDPFAQVVEFAAVPSPEKTLAWNTLLGYSCRSLPLSC